MVRPASITLPIHMFLCVEQCQNPTLAPLSALRIVVLTMRFARGAELARLVARR